MQRIRSAGFTLIELVMVLILAGIIASVVALNITTPIRGFMDLSRRAQLQDIAENALRRMTREVRLALPNSIRLRDGASAGLTSCDTGSASGNVCALEIIRTLEGGRYRKYLDGGASAFCTDDTLDFTTNNDCFEVLGKLQSIPGALGNQRANCGTIACLVIYNTGQPGANAYAGDNLAAIEAANADSITFNNADVGGFTFPWESPDQRFQIVDTPVSFVCDPTNGGLLIRHSDYNISASQAVDPGGLASLQANNVEACAFAYFEGVSTRSGLVSVAITVTKDGESVNLVEQIHVYNAP